MSLDRWLAVVGLLLAIPGFVVLFFTPEQTIAVLVGLLGVVLLGAGFVVRYFVNLAPFTMLSAEVTLDFQADNVQRAKLTKRYRIRPNFAHLSMMTHRNIAADGEIENLKWDDQPIPMTAIDNSLGEKIVTLQFPAPPRRWREFPGELSYDLVNSFPKDTESLVYAVDFPTKVAIIRISLPPSKPCKQARAYKIEGAGQRPISDPQVVGRVIEVKLRRPRVGSEFIVLWHW